MGQSTSTAADNPDDAWEALPLNGKYYGTIVDASGTHIEVWDHNKFSPPSRRQLDAWGIEDWDRADSEERFDLTCDSHYETERDYRLARLIAAAPRLAETLNGLLLYIADATVKAPRGVDFQARMVELLPPDLVDQAFAALREAGVPPRAEDATT